MSSLSLFPGMRSRLIGKSLGDLCKFNKALELASRCHSIRVFHKHTEMPILAFSSLLHENKKNPVTKMLPPAGIEPRQPLIISPTCSSLH